MLLLLKGFSLAVIVLGSLPLLARAARDSEPRERHLEPAHQAESLTVVLGKSSLVLQRNSSGQKKAITHAPEPQPNLATPPTSSSSSSSSSSSIAASQQSAGGVAGTSTEDLVSVTSETHHALARLLGIEGGELCPSESAPAPIVPLKGARASGPMQHLAPLHGCRLGCRCGIFQRCYSKHYDAPGKPEAGGLAAAAIDIGVCRLALEAYIAIGTLAALSIAGWIGTLWLRKANASHCDKKGSTQWPRPSRAELESRLLSSTALNDEQRKAVMDQFCETKKGVETFEKRPATPLVQSIPLKATQVTASN